MKPTAMLLTVILLITGTLLIGGSFTTKNKTGTPEHGRDHILPVVSLKEDKTTSLPQPVYEEATTPRAAKLKLIKPKINTIEGEGDTISCGVAPPLTEEDYADSFIMCNVATEAEYPGGSAAWQRYLIKNMRCPEAAIDNEIQSSVVVQFVVDEKGNVSDVEAISDSGALGAEAVRVIKQSGKWIPAQQIGNGRCIRSIKRQPFIICFKEE